MKTIYLLLGCFGLFMGAVGVAVPILPAFPFLMLAAYCFSKSSDRLSRWFFSSRLYKENLENFVRRRGMTRGEKTRIVLTVTITMAIGFTLMKNIPIGRIILFCVWVGHLLYFHFGITTLEEPFSESHRLNDGDECV